MYTICPILNFERLLSLQLHLNILLFPVVKTLKVIDCMFPNTIVVISLDKMEHSDMVS